MAVVSGQVIMLSDVNAARDFGLEPVEPSGDPIRPIVLKLIDRELMLVEVDRYSPPEPPVEAVDRELADVRARFATEDTFDAALARSGIDVAHLRQTLRENLRIRAYLDQRFTIPASGSEERRRMLVDEWVAGLRRRATVIDLSAPASLP
jgi:hypothetical protein